MAEGKRGGFLRQPLDLGGRRTPGIETFFRDFPALPKTELHLHLEGSLSPATLLSLARRNGSHVFTSPAVIRKRFQFQAAGAGFLLLYRDICRELSRPADYGLLARDLVRRLARERITYAEVYVSPAIVERIGLPWLPVAGAIEAVFGRFEKRTGSRVAVLLDSVRQWGPDAANRVLDLFERHPWPRVLGFGIGGDEASVPARNFARVYDRVRRLNLAPLIHAGEWAGPESVREALEFLGPRRIAHGVRAVEDPDLVAQLARNRIPLDICITSNLATGAVLKGVRHPALELLRAGVPVTLSTDDPTLFGTTLEREFAALARLGATVPELRRVLRFSRTAALGLKRPR